MRLGVCSVLMELCLDFTEVLVGILVVPSLGSGSELPQGMRGWRVEPSWVLGLLGLQPLWLTSLLGPGGRQQDQHWPQGAMPVS